MVNEIRRKAMMGSAEDDYLKGWLRGYIYMRENLTPQAGEDMIASPLLPMPNVGAGRLHTYYCRYNGASVQYFDANKEYLGYYLMNGERTASIAAERRYIRCSFPIATIDDCYILETTTNTYLWKGKNVE